MPASLIAQSLGKCFRHRDRAAAPTFRAWVEGGFRSRTTHSRFWALRGIDLAIAPGEMLGVIGRNGSGKSTLLRILGGVMQPDEGRVIASAPVRGLLDLNAGMHPDLSGRENIIISGVLSGLLKSEVLDRMESIIAFSELATHIDQPVRTYSSGMKLRLGFSIAAHIDPEILLIDEVLAVGDLGFQEKCLSRIDSFRKQGCAIVLISHDMSQIRQFCDRALWLDGGKIKASGHADEVVDAYENAARAAGAAARAAAGEPEDGPNRFGSKAVILSDVQLSDSAGNPVIAIEPGAGLSVSFTLSAAHPTPAHVSISVADAEGRLCFDANSETDGISLPKINGKLRLVIDLERLDLAPGAYFLSVGLWRQDWSEAYDMHMDSYPFAVSGDTRLLGVLSPPRRWRTLGD